MTEKSARLRLLLEKYMNDAVNDAESAELAGLINETEQSEVEDVVAGILDQAAPEFDDTRTAMILQKILKHNEVPARVMKLRWRRPVAAAVLAILIGSVAWYLFSERAASGNNVVQATIPEEVKAPVASRAMITLADGKTVYLDSLGTGSVALQGNVNLVKLANGQITYNYGGSAANEALIYNTLTNPRGSMVVDMQLTDGSRVWLNAGSSIRYPVAFTGNERIVEITGEAYFEVAHNAQKPFTVKSGTASVQVLGTHFNISAYDDEKNIKTTLLQGSVKVSVFGRSAMLNPGQQAVISRDNNDIEMNKDVDLDEVLAWKNGYFSFRHASVRKVMNQLSRWYDVDILYQGNIPERRFEGEMQRSLTLSQVLKLIGENNIHFKLVGKNLIVSP